MGWRIALWGLGFFVVMVGIWQLLYHTDVDEVSDLFNVDALKKYFTGYFERHPGKPFLSAYEHGIYFTFFVVLQLWNLFNVRYYRTDSSMLLEIRHFFTDRERFKESFSSGFVLVAAIILVGQFVIVDLLPDFFEVDRLSLKDWGLILLVTSPVFIVPEISRSIRLFVRHSKH